MRCNFVRKLPAPLGHQLLIGADVLTRLHRQPIGAHMVIELEFLEQISEDDWPLAQSVAFIKEHKEPWQVLSGLYSDKCIEFKDADGDALPTWKTQQILRNRVFLESPEIFIGITELGITRAYP